MQLQPPTQPKASAQLLLCEHCRTPIPPDAKNARFCCQGCEAVHDLLHEEGLDRYYALAGNQLSPAPAPASRRSHTWLEPLLEALPSDEDFHALELDVQGVHCAACVWLMNEVFRRRAKGGGEVIVNPSLGTVKLRWRAGQFDVRDWVEEIERFGYQFGPPRKEGRRPGIELPLRLGVSAALTINVMLFSLSFHFGLSPDDPEIFRLFTWLSLLLSTATVAIGGWPFFRSAALSLRSGVLHLDLPIALGIALVYAMSLVQLGTTGGRGDFAYFDTLNTFITLMLLGRFLQERVLQRNRRFLLEDDGAEGLLARVVRGERVEIIPAVKVEAGDEILIAPGDVIPTDATLLDAEATISMDWINGEAAPRRVSRGGRIEAGSFNAGTTALRAKTTERFVDSSLIALLRQPPPTTSTSHTAKYQQLWNSVAKRWVVTVLGVSSLGFLVWLPFGVTSAINVAVALLVITCPCAVGIAIPLAYELMQSRLRRVGFYGRTSDLLDRLTDVRDVVFDKTGTLTMGRLEVEHDLGLLPEEAREIAWNLAIRSSHPVSVAIARALGGGRWNAEAPVREVPGQGVACALDGHTWRLGRFPGFAHAPGETLLTRDDEVVARIATREVMRHDARIELQRLAARGYSLHLLSGDSQSRVDRLARDLGIDERRALGHLSPEEKAEAVRAIGGQHALFLGDGVNDSLAFQAALAAGTPAIDRPVMPSKSDFFLVGEGLGALSAALDGARELRGVVRKILALSLGYNVLAIAVALFGLMSPVAAAVSMPASTLTLIAITVASLKGQRPASASVGPGTPASSPNLSAFANANTPST